MKTIQISFRYNRFSAFVSFRRCPCVRVSVCVSVLLSLCQCFHLLLVGDALSQVNSCWFINRAFPLNFCHSFIHSGHFYSALSSPLLLRGAPDYSTDTTVSKFHAEAHRQLKLKDLPKVPTWRLKSGSRTHDPPVESHRLNQGATRSRFCRVVVFFILGFCNSNTFTSAELNP